jgi:Thrombospondin type 3 repeat
VNEFASQVLVKQGGVLGATFSNNASCSQGSLGSDFRMSSANNQDPATGAETPFSPNQLWVAANVLALVETDNDGDLLGDDSQDADDDNDTVPDGTDNCPLQGNAGQENTDGQAGGDACDDDDDDDGLTDAAEAELGTDPKVSDTDGDGVSDGRDRCPAKAGLVNGCPVTPLPDTVPPGVTLTGVPARIKRAALLRDACASASSPARRRRSRPSYSPRHAAPGSPSCSTSCSPGVHCPSGLAAGRSVCDPRLVGRARRFRVRVRLTVTDASGNRRLMTRTIRVR